MGILGLLGIGKDIKDSADGISGGIERVIGIAKGVLPAEQQVEVEKIQADVEVKLAGIRAQSESVLRDFIIKYEGSADQIPKWLLAWRSVIRPAFTTFFFLQLMVLVGIDVFNVLAHQMPFTEGLLTNMPSAWWWMVGIVLTFWFGGHGIERAVEKLNGKEKK